MSEEEQKAKYINENILEKGYNPEALSNFIIRTLNRPIESISFDQLKQMIEEFKIQDLQETYSNMQSTTQDEQKDPTLSDPFYSPARYELRTLSQQDNELLKLENQKKKIVIKISEPKKEKQGGLFSKPVYSYRVECTEIKSDVRRTYSDFEWLKNQLALYYSLRLIPPVMKESSFLLNDIVNKQYKEEDIEMIKIKYLNYFINSLMKKKILRTSPLLYEFLELNDNDFKKYKDFLGKYKFELNLTFDNLKTTKGNLNCDLKPSDVKITNQYGKKCNNLSELCLKIEKNISNISADFRNLDIHMKEISECFDRLSKELKGIKTSENLVNVYSHLNNIFTSWSQSYGKQAKFFRDDFRNVFNYMSMEYSEMEPINKKYLAYKKEYEDFTNKINKKKEELFAQKDYNKWEVAPGTEDQISKYLTDKKLAFEKMLYKENVVLYQEKQRVACTIHIMNKQFNKLLLHQGENLDNYITSLQQTNQLVIGDAFNLVKLFSIKLHEQTD